ncbi:early boundary activity protein 2-like [Battus philenor]|uniref:early boundary activity protein 2-like n=1 Tax=Battus philenor TaxID=42288 RepID=UPI0035CEBAE3
MSSKEKIEKWLIAEWSSGRGVNSRSMVKVEHEISQVKMPATGDTVENMNPKELPNGRNVPAENKPATEQNTEEGEGEPSGQQNVDFSSSASSWVPSDVNVSTESDDVKEDSKKMKPPQTMKQYSNKKTVKKGPLPVHRPNAIIPNVLQPRQTNAVDKKPKCKYGNTINIKKSQKKSSLDSIRRTTPPNGFVKANHQTPVKQILKMNVTFAKLYHMIKNLKSRQPSFSDTLTTEQLDQTIFDKTNNDTVPMSEGEESDKSLCMDSDRSDDNVLITNKYDKENVFPARKTENNKEEEWIPIGSGKTLIHKDKYKNVNWRSYTIATRTLLLATFPRRVLATHSLTGKRSPAFKNKPAKMCLDPKIVSDVIIEITSRFKVKSNLVRSIITTKCADECKMYKMRMKQKGKQESNRENTPPVEKMAE